MIYTELTKRALKIAFEVHKEQTDKSGLPYVFHPFHLAEQMNDEISVCVALLHDVLEDGGPKAKILLDSGDFPEEMLEAVRLLTHQEGTPYMDYVKAIKGNALATKVKITDLKHNMDLARLDRVMDKDLIRNEKYKSALNMLEKPSNIASLHGGNR